MRKIISTKVRIYDTEYTLISHRDGGISIKEPYVKWIDNSGALAFRKVRIPSEFTSRILACFHMGSEEGLYEILMSISR